MPTPTPPGQLPLTRWQQTWRYLAALAISVSVAIVPAHLLWDDNHAWLIGDLALGVVSFALMAFRRRYPVAVAAVLAVLGAISSSVAGPGVVAFVSLATHRNLRQLIPISVLSFAAGLVYAVVTPAQGPWYIDAAFSAVVVGVLLATGMYIGARRELVATLQDRAERAEREQALMVAQGQATERARIAREMHDVLAHRLSLVAMHAGALASHRSVTGPDQERGSSGPRQRASGACRSARGARAVARRLR